MKISSVSKKVLASALSAAMVVAFAPTVAFGADLGGGSNPAVTTGAIAQVQYTENGISKYENFSKDEVTGLYGAGLQGAFDFAAVVQAKGATNVKVVLQDNVRADALVNGTVTLDLNGFAWTNAGNDASATPAITNNGGSPITIDGSTRSIDTGVVSYVEVGTVPAGAASDDYNAYFHRVPAGTSGATVAADGYSYIQFDDDAVAGLKFYQLESTSTSVTATAGNLTIVDSSEAKTGSVDGNETYISGTAGAYETNYVARSAVNVESGATLTIKGGTFTTGDTQVTNEYGNDQVIAISGAVASISGATIEANAGTAFAAATGTATKSQDAFAVSSAVGSVKKSSIKVSAGDAKGANVQAKGVAVTGAVEESTIIATSGKVTKDYTSTAQAIDAQGAATYKKVVATATANGETKDVAEVSGVSAASTATAINTGGSTVTINSGEYTGELKGGAAKFVLKGGKYTQHVKGTASVPAGFAGVCMTSNDYVYKKATGKLYANGTELAADDAVLSGAYGAGKAFESAVNNLYEAAITGKNTYSVGYTLANGASAADIAAIVTDFDQADKLSYIGRINYGTGAAAAAAATATDEQKLAVATLNAAVEAVDAAAKAKGQVAFTYLTASLDVVSTSTSGRVTTVTPVAAINNLGKKVKTGSTVDGHGNITDGTLTDNTVTINPQQITSVGSAVILGSAEKGLTTATKTPAALYAVGTDVAEITATNVSATSTPDYKFVTTDLSAPIAVLSKNAGSVDPEEPAVEKATQSIEVDQKSMTVKVGSKKKTSKGKSFNIGATAETDVTASKKSGSSKITVSESGKVKLAKGAVKGKTYTAKVSLKAAASDAYLAAAKTITVKFVIK